jgi:hypothetical protein
MARRKTGTANVKIADFMKPELTTFVSDLATRGGGIKVGEGDLVSALVLAARGFPVEFLRAAVLTYWDREAEELRKLAIADGGESGREA